VIVAYLKVLCWHLLGEADKKNYKKKPIWDDGSLPEISTGYFPNFFYIYIKDGATQNLITIKTSWRTND
jgi:hypothetical protein